MVNLCGRPLKFGDQEQIDELERMAEKVENEKKWIVRFVLDGAIEIEVEAPDEDTAKEIAYDELDCMTKYDIANEVEIDFESVTEVK